MSPRLNWDTKIGIGVIILGIIILILTIGMPSVPLGIGPAVFPRIVGFSFIILGIILILQNINLKVVEKKVYSWENLKRILLITVLGFLYIFWVRYIGFLFLTPFLILSLLYLFDYKELVKGILISIGVTLVLYVLFYSIFKVPLPTFSLF